MDIDWIAEWGVNFDVPEESKKSYKQLHTCSTVFVGLIVDAQLYATIEN